MAVSSVSATEVNGTLSSNENSQTDNLNIPNSDELADYEDEIIKSSEEEKLGDYNYDENGIYYDDSISGTVISSQDTYNVGDTVILKLAEKETYDYGANSEVYVRVDGSQDTSTWELVGTYSQLASNGVEYTLKQGGSHAYQIILQNFNGGGSMRWFAKATPLITVEGESTPKYSNSFYIEADKSNVEVYERFNVYFKSEKWLLGGTVDFYINGYKVGSQTYNTFGSTYIYVLGAPAGILNITAYYSGDSSVSAGWAKPVIVTVNPTKTTITADSVVMNAGESKSLTIKLIDTDGDAVPTQKVVAKINGVEYEAKTDDSGVAVINIPTTLKAGNYTVDLSYNGGEWQNYQTPSTLRYAYDYEDGEDYLHSGCIGTTKITVNGVNEAEATKTTVSLDKNNVPVGSDVIIKPTVKDENGNIITEGKVSIKIDGNTVATIDAGKDYTYSADKIGDFKVVAEYLGLEDKYESSVSDEAPLKVNIIGTETTISLNRNNVEVGESIDITPTVTGDDGKTLTEGDVDIKVNGEKVATVKPGESYTYTTTSTGDFKVIAEFKGTEKYDLSKSEEVPFTVKDLTKYLTNTTLSSNNETGKAGYKKGDIVTILNNVSNSELGSSIKNYFDITDGTVNEIIHIYLNGELIGDIKASPNGDWNNGVKVSLSPGWNNFTAVYGGNNYLESSNSNTLAFYVPYDTTTTVNVDPSEVDAGSDIKITPTVAGDDGKTLTEGDVDIKVNGEKVATVKPGESYTYTADKKGKHNVTAEFKGNDDYNPSESDKESFNVKTIGTETTVNLDKNSKNVGDDVTVTPSVKDANGNDVTDGEVEIFVNGNSIGKIKPGDSVSYTTDNEGKDNITAKYLGSEKYDSSEGENSVNVSKIPTKTTVTVNPDTVYLGESSLLTPHVVDDKGNSVTEGLIELYVDNNLVATLNAGESIGVKELLGVSFDNTVLNANSNGYSYTSDATGEHTVTAKYLGTDKYGSSQSEDVPLKVNENETAEDNNSTEEDNNTNDTPNSTDDENETEETDEIEDNAVDDVINKHKTEKTSEVEDSEVTSTEDESVSQTSKKVLDSNATGNPIMLVLISLILIGTSQIRRRK